MEVEGQKVARRFFSVSMLALALLVAGAGVSRGQVAPNPPPAPQVAPEPPEPLEVPEPPEPPELPQVFVLNDGTAHLGVTLGDVTTEKAQELKLPAVAGALVNSVQKNSAAAKAGILAGDAIMEFDGIRVRSSAELRRLIRETPAGRAVEMKIVRDGKTRVLSAKLEVSGNQFNYSYNAPEVHIPSINVPEIHIPPMDFPAFGGRRATLGISGEDLTPQLAEYFGVKQGKGVLIFEVTKGGAADKAALKAGDVIAAVDGKPISGVDELRAALNDNFTGDAHKVSLIIIRDHRELNVNADLTRTHPGVKHTSSLAVPGLNQQLAQIQAQASQQRELANLMRLQAERQRAQVQGEVLKQQEYLRTEWQQQLQQQMLSLKDHLKKMRNLQVAQRQDGEI